MLLLIIQHIKAATLLIINSIKIKKNVDAQDKIFHLKINKGAFTKSIY